MALSTTATADEFDRAHGLSRSVDITRSLNSAVAWGAIAAGAPAAASLSLILLILGVGLGLSSVLLTSVIGSILSGGVQTGASMAGGIANTASGDGALATHIARGRDVGPMGYFVDSLFRRDPASALRANETAGSQPGMNATEQAARKDVLEVSRIFMNVSRSEPLPPEDIRYVGQLVAERTGLSQQEAEKRVVDVPDRVVRALTAVHLP